MIRRFVGCASGCRSADDKTGLTDFVTGTGLRCQFGLLPWLVGEMKKGGDGFEVDDEYDRYCMRTRIRAIVLEELEGLGDLSKGEKKS